MKRFLLAVTAISAITLCAVPVMARDHFRGHGGYPAVRHGHSYSHHGHGHLYGRRAAYPAYRHSVGRRSYGHGYGYPGYARPYGCAPYSYGHSHGHVGIYGPQFGIGVGW